MPALSVRMEPIGSVTPHPSNPRREHDVEGIARSIQAFGWRQPIVVWDGDGHVLAGHGRLLAAKHLGLDKVPVHHVPAKEMTAEQASAYRLADNRSAEGSEWDEAMLLAELEAMLLAELEALGDRERELAGFDEEYLEELRRREDLEGDDAGQTIARHTLAERFGVPPFSVLYARDARWQTRKAAWIALGIQSELGRGAGLTGSGPMPVDLITGPTDQLARRKAEAAASFKDQGAQSALQEGKPHRKPTATPGSTPMPAADYSKSKARGDGRGQAIKQKLAPGGSGQDRAPSTATGASPSATISTDD